MVSVASDTSEVSAAEGTTMSAGCPISRAHGSRWPPCFSSAAPGDAYTREQGRGGIGRLAAQGLQGARVELVAAVVARGAFAARKFCKTVLPVQVLGRLHPRRRLEVTPAIARGAHLVEQQC